MPAFARYIGIDYSGAQTPSASLKGLRVYIADGDAPPIEAPPPPSARRYWSRRGVAEWLVDRLAEGTPTLVGIDHGFSFPLPYFEAHGVARDWDAFLDDFQRHWPTNEDVYVDMIREGAVGAGAARKGETCWRRLTERRAGSAKSVFHFDVQGSVAKSTHSGLPWLRYIRRNLGQQVHFWPFDGWDIPAGRSAIAEVYPALWNRGFANEGRTADQHDAFSVAAWLSHADRGGGLADALSPQLSVTEMATAKVEGWVLGVPGESAPIRMARGEAPLDPERVAYWYFRLNGFFQIENFVVHPSRRGSQRTDADLLAVRFPYRAERLVDDPSDVMQDDVQALDLGADGIDVAIVEVKTGQCALNGPWTREECQNVERVLAAMGCVPREEVSAVAREIYKSGVHNTTHGLRIRLIAVGGRRNEALAVDFPAVRQIVWADMLKFIWARFDTYRRQKTQVDQWNEQGRRLKEFVDQTQSAESFVRKTLSLIGAPVDF